MKKEVVMILVFFVCMAFMSVSVSAAPIVIKIAHGTPKTFSLHPAVEAFKKEVEQKTGGKVDIQIFSDASLGAGDAMLSGTRMGSIQMFCLPNTEVQRVVPEMKITTLPFIWQSYDTIGRALDSEAGRRLGELAEKQGLKLIAWGYGGYFGIQNKKREVKNPADLKGLKIRVMGDPILIDSMNAIGAMAVVMNGPEVYSAMEQGVIDGASTAAQLLYSYKYYEIPAKYYTHLKIHSAPVMLMINLNFWKGLSPDIQKAMTEASKTFTKVFLEYYTSSSQPNSDQNILKMFREKGVTVTEPDTEPFRKLVIPVVRKYREEIGSKIVDGILEVAGFKLE